jgi:NACHT domain
MGISPLTPAVKASLFVIFGGALLIGGAYLYAWQLAVVVAAVFLPLSYLFRAAFLPLGAGAMRVRLASIVGWFALAVSHDKWAEVINGVVAAAWQYPWIKEKLPWIESIHLGGEPSDFVLVTSLFAVFFVNFFLPDRSIAGTHPTPLAADFPDLTFEKKLASFCSGQAQFLETTDRESNWSPDYYTELDAEVEVVSRYGVRSKRKILNLQWAIRRDHSTAAFLVLGDPGAGKSVALRKLARDMLKEVSTTGRIPIYINLREWSKSDNQLNPWTEDNKPTIEQLEHFVVTSIKSRGDVFTEEFTQIYFRKLWEHGRLFFIFDSFDEIPQLLDANEESWLIDELSALISRFIQTTKSSRGLLASRVFRRPTQKFLSQKTLDLRPLTEQKIIQGLSRFPAFKGDLRSKLFRSRLDLVPLARNPFLMALLGEWVAINNDLPNSHAELYQSYLSKRLALCSGKMRAFGLTESQVLDGAVKIANFVFQSEQFGLEAPIQMIEANVAHEQIGSVLEILSYARIARVSAADPKSFAFVHRRFIEYFVTKELLQNPSSLPTEHIPTDSRGRDALVLYAQLCSDEEAKRLANFCWTEIKKNFLLPKAHLRAIHAFRFLVDAFRSRKSVVDSLEKELADFIESNLKPSKSILFAKISLEGVGLLSDARSVEILKTAFEMKNPWLQETAFRACRQLAKVDSLLEDALKQYIVRMSPFSFWRARSEILFSLSLSESLKGVWQTARWRMFNVFFQGLGIGLAVAIYPGVVLLGLSLSLFGPCFDFLKARIDDLFALLNVKQKPDKDGSLIRLVVLQMGASSRDPLGKGYFAWLLDGLEAFNIQFALTLCSIILVMLSAQYFLFPLTVATQESPLNLNFLSTLPSNFAAPVCGLLALFLFEWRIVKQAQEAWKTWKRRDWKWLGWKWLGWEVVVISLLTTTVGLLVFLVGKALLEFLNIYLPPSMKTVLAWVSLFFAGGTLVFVVGRYLFSRFRLLAADHRVFKSIEINSAISREEISDALKSLLTDRYKIKYINILRDSNVSPHGDWPNGEFLSITTDEVKTEVAKLEEKWLKLDR